MQQKVIIEGDTRWSPCFLSMADVIEQITSLLTPLLEGTDIFIVSIKIKPTNNIKVFLDADEGLSVEKSIWVNRKLYAAIEERSMYPEGDFSLEVSSPGVDEPLTSTRQYRKNIGRTIAITPVEDDNEIIGVLKDVAEDNLVIEQKVGKKKELVKTTVPFETIKKIIVQIVF